ncbi:DUF3298 domain-containing protein [Bacteroidales bacterium OttesenSCG-928-I21]|nr:DUF3298 domain-containing protein [Bacteroidales bacterium OttesenSCG-928-I21]
MKKTIYLIATCFAINLFLYSCNNEPSKLKFDTINFEEKTNINNLPETQISISVPIIDAEHTSADKINTKVFETIKYLIAQENSDVTTYEELLNDFIEGYKQFLDDYPDYQIAWEAIINASIEHNSHQNLNIKIESYLMTGGAHGNPFTISLIFNSKTGKELKLDEIIKDKKSLQNLAETKFREKYNIPKSQSINSTGFMFENEKFALPENIFITNDGLLLFYNHYEVAAYSEGTKEILIPYKELKDNLIIKI